MKGTKLNRYPLILALILLGLPFEATAQNMAARADVSPQVIMMGESSVYTITFLGTTRIPNLNTPRVEGLEFNSYMSTSTMQRIVNGRSTVEVQASWDFRPTRLGDFTIPGRTVEISGEQVRIPSVEVRVVPPSEEARSRAFLRLELPEGPYFVGQALPAKLSVFIRRDLSISNIQLPESEGDAFVHSEFGNNPNRLLREVDGRSYDVLEWEILVTPIKSGPAALTFRQNLIIQVPVSDGRVPSIFSFRQARQESLTLVSEPVETDILPLPEENQPASFQDAIGQLTVTAALSDRELNVGKPITLVVDIQGKGNFDRISPPEIPEWEQWRTYPPKVAFSPSDSRGLEGTKSFEYILIPQSVEITEFPGFSYSIFNPQSGKYETTVLQAEPVTVGPPLGPVTNDPLVPPSSETVAEEIRIPENILPLRPNPGHFIQGTTQTWQHNRYWIVNGLVGLVLLVLAAWQLKRKRLSTNLHLARRHEGGRKIRKSLQTAQRASLDGNPGAFFEAARFSLQERISHLTRNVPEARTLATSDCLEILSTKGVPEEIQARVQSLLDAADAHQFAGVTPEAGQLPSLHKELQQLITELNTYLK